MLMHHIIFLIFYLQIFISILLVFFFVILNEAGKILGLLIENKYIEIFIIINICRNLKKIRILKPKKR